MEWLINFRDNLYFLEPEKLFWLWGMAGLGFLGLLIWMLRSKLRSPRTLGSRYPWLGRIKFWFFCLLALGLLIVSGARPYLKRPQVLIKRGPLEVIFLIDRSFSMFLKDWGPSRLDLAVGEVFNLLDQKVLKKGDRAGLFLFGKSSFLRVHLSYDLERLATELSRIGLPQTLWGNESIWGSDLAMALEHLYQSLDAQDLFLKEQQNKKNGLKWPVRSRVNRVVVVLSDGDFFYEEKPQSEATSPEQSGTNDRAKLNQSLVELRRRGLKFLAVGIGGRRALPLTEVLKDYRPNTEYDPALQKELKGLTSALNISELDYLTRFWGGSKFIVDRSGVRATDFLREKLDAWRSLSVQRTVGQEREELWPYGLGLALIILMAAIVWH